VQDGAKQHGDEARTIEVVVQLARLVDHHERVRPDIPFRMPFRFLLAANERHELRKHTRDDAQIQREAESKRGPLRLQQLFDLAPDPLRRQIVEWKAAAQGGGRFIEREVEPGRELHRAQRPQAVIRERARIDGAQEPPLEIGAAVERIFVLIRQRVPRDCVDREVATLRGVGNRHRGVAAHVEPLVAASLLGFSARQCDVDLALAAAGRSQFVDRKALADSFDASERREELDQSMLCDPEYLDVEVFRRPAAQAIAYPAADD
jgi:hypothetical protein